MNYCIVAFAIVIIISGIQWIVDGRKNYAGPQMDVDAMRNEAVEGMKVDTNEAPAMAEGGVKDKDKDVVHA